MFVDSRATCRIPGLASDLADALPAGRSQRSPGLGVQHIGNESTISESESYPATSTVQHRASVASSIGGDSAHFKSRAIIECTGHRPTDYGNAANHAAPVRNRDTEFVKVERPVMAMVALNKYVRVGQRTGNNG
jgi:hypothetical protein